jgi:hypothetical protein
MRFATTTLGPTDDDRAPPFGQAAYASQTTIDPPPEYVQARIPFNPGTTTADGTLW